MCRVFDGYRQSIPEMMAEQKTTGLSIALVDRDGILWTAGFGYTDHNREIPVTPETLFGIQSISKTFTATAVMAAVRDGLVELDVPIIEYWPQFTVNSRFEENPQEKITLRHLLSHTSGIAQEAPLGNVRRASYLSLEENIQSISETWLRHKVGERYYYGDLGYDLASYIIQIRSGQPFAEYLKDKIFTPLNMPNSSADAEFIRNHPNRAMGNMRNVKQAPLVMDIPKVGSGGVYTNAKELARLAQFFLNWGKVDGQTVLDENLVTTMVTPSIYNKNYGLGINILHDDHGIYRLSHTGGWLGFTSGIYWLPEYGIGCVVLYNSDRIVEIGDVFLKLINEKLVEKNESFSIPSGENIYSNGDEHPAYQPLDPDSFTPFKPVWKKYIGSYKYMWSGWKFGTLAKMALALGATDKYTHVKIYEKDGYLYIDTLALFVDDGGRLDEYLPGLFFTPSGKCLDLRGPKLTWQNYQIKKK
jgi:CubicO group peptidase (beta-lactamase class C family)